MLCGFHAPTVAEQDANARLIAEAPETAAERDRLRAVNAELRTALQLCIACDSSTHEAKMQARKQARALLARLDAEKRP